MSCGSKAGKVDHCSLDCVVKWRPKIKHEVERSKPIEELVYSPYSFHGLQQQSTYLSAVNIFLFITAFLGNSPILAALHKESSLHPPSKLLYRCLATTDLLVGLVSQPLTATYWMSLVHQQWNLSRYVSNVVVIASYTLCLVSLLTMTAISVDRLIALLLRLRYKTFCTDLQ